MSILYYDCFAGISGDMHLAALLDLGVDYDELVLELTGLGMEGYGVQATRASRKGVFGTQVRVVTDPNQPPHRDLRQIEAIIGASLLRESVQSRAIAVFRRLAEAEAQGISAKAVTPFLLDRIFTATRGRSLDANIALVLNNARLAAQIARELI